MRLGQRIVLFTLLGLFLTSAIFGALISYNQSLAWARFTAIAFGVMLCVFLSMMPEQVGGFGASGFPLVRVTLAVLPVVLVSYFVLTNDWTVRLGKIAWLDPLLSWFATWQPRVAGLTIDSNSLGGALAMLLPLQFAALRWKRTAERFSAVILLLISFLGLIVSASRSAWLAFGLVIWIAVIWGLLGRVIPRWQVSHERDKRNAMVGVFLVCLVLTPSALMLTPLGSILLEAGGGHWTVARHSLDLVSDYVFTGIGLGAFTMAYSSYLLLVHVPHTIHAHNLFLDIWLEQGLIGLIAFLGMIVAGVLNIPGSRWRIVALASLAVVLIHGLLDDVFYGYGGNTIPLLYVPLGLLGRISAPGESRFSRRSLLSFTSVFALIVLLIAVLPTTRAMFQANLGALEQTRAELSVYHWPQWGIQDELRCSSQIDLIPAISQYQAALATNPSNATANRRLGQIELSLGQYDSARRHLETAYAVDPAQRATRQMLGESYAIAGDSRKAVELWNSIDLSQNQIAIRQWWYDYIGDRGRALGLRQALAEMR